jgi:hypothetical protein
VSEWLITRHAGHVEFRQSVDYGARVIEVHFLTSTPRFVAYSIGELGRQPMGVFLDELLDCVNKTKELINESGHK